MSSEKWIQSFTGRKVTPLDLQPDQVCIEDIAHALACKTRFTGHSIRPYSVAEHCVRASQNVAPSFQLAALLHDCSETYLPDIAGPIKSRFGITIDADQGGCRLVKFETLEDCHAIVILRALGLSSIEGLIYSPEVQAIDLSMLKWEVRDLLGPPPEPWTILEGVELPKGAGEPLIGWDWAYAERCFLDRFAQLNRVTG